MAISATFTADFSQFTAAAQGAQDSLTAVRTVSQDMGGDVEKQAYQVGVAFGNVAKSVTAFATDYISAFAEEEAATSRLSVALTNTGHAADGTIEAYTRMASQFQATTRFADDAVLAAQTVFTSMGKIGPELMEPAITAAANLAIQLGIGIPEAASKIATVIGSDGAKLGDLKKYLSDTEIKGKSAAEVLEIFNSKFGGQAAADIGTTAGQVQRFNNQLDDFKGKVGGVLQSALGPLMDAFGRLDPMLQTVIAGGSALLVALVPIGIAVGTLMTGVTTLVESMGGWSVVMAAIEAGLGAIALPAAAVVAAVTAIYVAWKYWDEIVGWIKAISTAFDYYLVKGLTAAADLAMAPIRKIEGGFKWLYDQVVGHSYVPDMMAAIGSEFGRLDELMVKPAQLASDATAKAFDGAKQALGAAMQGGVQLPGSRIEQSGFQQYLISPEGYRVPMERTATGNSVMPANWWAMYTGRESSPLNSMFTGTELATAANNRPPPVNITINGSVLSTQDQMSTMVQDAMMQAYRQGGNLLPV